MGDRYLVVRVSEEDVRTLMYAPEGERQITITHEQEVDYLEPRDLRALKLWDEAESLGKELLDAQSRRPQWCNAYFGDFASGGTYCTRKPGHPPIDEDGVGHSTSARYRGL